ncbi:MAG: DUF4445 domain-containing protein [Anaerolineae bacterium]|nr:DUF4445 domain-containing protein [Anaerolineae bacterium]
MPDSHDKNTLFLVEFEPVGRRIEVRARETLLDAAQQAGVELVALCGGVGACDTCRVRLMRGQLTPPTLVEEEIYSKAELAEGWRLACQSHPRSAVKLDVPPESLTTPQRLQVEGESEHVAPDPAVTAFDAALPPPHMHDLRDDITRLQDTLRAAGSAPVAIGLPVLRTLSPMLRGQGWRARLAVYDDGAGARELVAALPEGARLLGFAADIGTTSIAAYLVDVATGEILAKLGAMNPQIGYGEDVVSRIQFINEHPDRRDVLRTVMAEALNDLAGKLCAEVGDCAPSQIVDAVLVGNTAMHHIVAGLPIRQLGEAPYLPVTSAALSFPAREIGLRFAEGAQVYMPPVIAGFVGADHLAMLLATGAWSSPRTTIAIDIGTNTEVSLTHEGRLYSCSCASGPAFEGAHIRDGMRAAPGAIERVQVLDDGALHIQTIGHQPAVGICGSGILDAVAVMAEHGLVDSRGAIQAGHPLVGVAEGKSGLVLARHDSGGSESAGGSGGRAIAITRKDVAEIQLAKGAIRAGIEVLLDEAGIAAAAVEDFIIAGAFGTYIRVESALRIGMFPALPLERFRQVGNAAGMGAKQLLISRQVRAQALDLAGRIHYIELTTRPGFQDEFVSRMALVES